MCLFIDAEKATEGNPDGYSVARLCRVLGVNRSTYYSWLAGRETVAERQRAEDELTEEIREIHGKSRGAYGAPRVTAVLRRRGQADQPEEGRADHAGTRDPRYHPPQAP
ncbi:IS3 family transposase [Streptomyces sp. NPDC059717]|uniref:IS3 family transposase n=1 Tax=Streptomyces sp. NPDC059717 TaxID=3346922 RepID=UPI0036A79500